MLLLVYAVMAGCVLVGCVLVEVGFWVMDTVRMRHSVQVPFAVSYFNIEVSTGKHHR